MSYPRLQTTYDTYNYWYPDFDLRKVHAWYVNCDTLFVIHNIGDKLLEYPPCCSADDEDHTEHYVDEVLVEFKKAGYHNPLRGMDPKNPGKRLIFPS